jgi:hypothetical protein
MTHSKLLALTTFDKWFIACCFIGAGFDFGIIFARLVGGCS